jgi:DNA repair protein RadC
MSPKAADPTRYKLHVVSFSVMRDSAPAVPRPSSHSRPKLNDPAAVANLARQIIADDAREHFWVLMLDSQNRLVAAHEVSTGTLSASLVHPREVFGPALRLLGVASVVLVHNHPSGDVKPSREDLRLTRQLVDSGKLLDIPVHDHVIVGSGSQNYTSLAAMGAL